MAARKPDKLVQTTLRRWVVPAIAATADELVPSGRGGAAPAAGSAASEPTGAVLVDEFASISGRLAAAKTGLDALPASAFDTLMGALDLYAPLKRTLRECGMPISTNASLKMFETLGQLQLIRPGDHVRAFCNAELPGAFIGAINHFVRTRCPGAVLDWVASSYYPADAAARGDPTILGDHYGLYSENRDRWLMGPAPNGLPPGAAAVSGDLTERGVVATLAAAVRARFGGATLYTSDAGIDASSNYNQQEELTAALNFGQTACGLLALAPGGALIVKQYTFFCRFSRELVALLAALFDRLEIVKQRTSRPGNSEVYLVGIGFRGVGPELAEALLARVELCRRLGPAAWPPLVEPALRALVDAPLLRIAEQIYGTQVQYLIEAMELFRAYRPQFSRLRHDLEPVAHRARASWLRQNPVPHLGPAGQLRMAKLGGTAEPVVRILGPDTPTLTEAAVASNARLTGEPQLVIHTGHWEDVGPPTARHALMVGLETMSNDDFKALQARRAIAICKNRATFIALGRHGIIGLDPGCMAPSVPQEPKDPRLFYHNAAGDPLRGTLDLLRAWFEHGCTSLDAELLVEHAPADAIAYWESLPGSLVAAPVERRANVRLTRVFHGAPPLDAAVHLCPSRFESWGGICAGRAARAVVITTDAPPMNELIDADCGILVPTDPTRPSQLEGPVTVTMLPADIASLARAIAKAAALGPAARAQLGDAALARHLAERDRGHRKLRPVFG